MSFLSGGTYRIPWTSPYANVLKQNLFHSIATNNLTVHPLSDFSSTYFLLFWSSGHQYESFLNRNNPYNQKPLLTSRLKIKELLFIFRVASVYFKNERQPYTDGFRNKSNQIPSLLYRL